MINFCLAAVVCPLGSGPKKSTGFLVKSKICEINGGLAAISARSDISPAGTFALDHSLRLA